MDITNIVSDEGDVDKVQKILASAKLSLSDSAMDYAKDCLDYAQAAFDMGMQRTPTYIVNHNIEEARKYYAKSCVSMENCMNVTNMLLKSEETGDHVMDEDNEDMRVTESNKDLVMAILESATNRVGVALATIPENAKRGTLTVPVKFVQEEDGNGQPEEE